MKASGEREREKERRKQAVTRNLARCGQIRFPEVYGGLPCDSEILGTLDRTVLLGGFIGYS